LKFGRLSMIRLASSFKVVVEFGLRSVVLIGIDERWDEIIGLSFVICSDSFGDFVVVVVGT